MYIQGGHLNMTMYNWLPCTVYLYMAMINEEQILLRNITPKRTRCIPCKTVATNFDILTIVLHGFLDDTIYSIRLKNHNHCQNVSKIL